MTNGTETATCSAQVLLPMLAYLRGRGHDVDALLAPMDLRWSDLQDSTLRIAHRFLAPFLDQAVQMSGDPALGLHVVETMGPGVHDLFGYLAATSATGREAFQRASRYVRLLDDVAEIRLEIDGDRSVCRNALITGDENNVTNAEIAVGIMIRVAQEIVGSPTEIEAWFVHAEPAYAAEYERILQVPIRFGARCNALVGSAASVDAPLPHADSALCDLLDRHAQELLARVPAATGICGRVRERLAAELPNGDPSAERVAALLGMSARTLRRKLADERTSHQQILDQVRSELATSYLSEQKLSVNEVAFLLGFSDASAFNKAFRRWTGVNPRGWLLGERSD